MVSHGNLLHNSRELRRCFGYSAESRGMIWLPPYHDMGLIGGILQPLYGGFPATLMSPVAFLQSPLRWLAAISRDRATITGGPDFAYDLCVRRIPPAEREVLDLSSWEVAFSGAEPVRAATLERFAAGLRPLRLPAAGLLSLLRPGRGDADRQRRAGLRRGGRAGVRGRGAREPPRRAGGRGQAAGGQRPVPRGPAAGGRRSRDRDPLPAGWGGRDLGGRPQRGAGLLEPAGGDGRDLRRAAAGRRRAVPAHRRPRVPGRRRAVRHRPAQGPDHHPRPQPLPAGHRGDGRGGAPGPAPRLRPPRSRWTSRARSAWWWWRRSSGRPRGTWSGWRRRSARPWPRSTRCRCTRSC